MAEISRLDRLWLALLRAPLSWWARPHVLPEDLRRRYARHDRPICYVLSMPSPADVLVLEKVCALHDLPAPLEPLRRPLPARSAMFLERRAGFWGDRIDHRISAPIRQLVGAAFADRSLEVDLVPVTVLWGRAPDKEGSWLRMILTENWERAGRFRRLLSVVVNGRNLFVQVGDPVSQQAALEDSADAPRAVRRVTRILRTTLAPARAPARIKAEAVRIAETLLGAFDYVGVMAVEMFETRAGQLLANEIAPRVHNSGHWTIDACHASQFEQHIRAVCGWPLGDASRHSDAVMTNLLGAEALDWQRLAVQPSSGLHLYGKGDALLGRKMGHITRLYVLGSRPDA